MYGVLHPEVPPAPPELRVELEHSFIGRPRFVLQPEPFVDGSQNRVIHLAQRIVLDRAFRLLQGLLGVSDRKQVEVRVPLAHVPRDGRASCRESKAAPRLGPVQVEVPGHDAQHAVPLGKIGIRLQRSFRQLAGLGHRIVCGHVGYGGRQVMVRETCVRQRVSRIDRDRLLETLATEA